jgi:hypothetical protein
VDVVGVLTDNGYQTARNYWKALKLSKALMSKLAKANRSEFEERKMNRIDIDGCP